MKKILILGLLIVFNANSKMFFYSNEAEGYFKDTKIVRLIDVEYGVVCYLLTPKVIETRSSYSQGQMSTIFKGDIGSLSCVKLNKKSKK